jgi:hypothetical protein
VHGGNGGAGEGAADQRAGARQRQAEADGGNGDGDQGRENGAGNVVIHRHAGMESQHGDEMGGPDAIARDQACTRQPVVAARTVSRAGARNHVHGRGAGQEAERTGQDDQAQIVLIRNASNDFQHE